MILNHTAYKNETPYKCNFVITQFLTNVTVMLPYGVIQITYNIRHIKPYKPNTKVEDFNPKNTDDSVNI